MCKCGFKCAVEIGDMWIVCWPKRWESEDRSNAEEMRGDRKGISASGVMRDERRNGSGVDGRSCRPSKLDVNNENL